MIILGAGQAGLLAARRIWEHDPVIVEKQKSLPNNHSALLRFRTDKIGKVIGVPFKKVNVYKGILSEDGKSITNIPNIRDINAYSLKSTGYSIERSIINTKHAMRFIAPANFIEKLAYNANIQYNCDAKDYIIEKNINPIISTIPMPELMRLLDYRLAPIFKMKPIWTINCELLNVDIYQTLYVPYDENTPYRISITGNKMTIEFAYPPIKNHNYIEQYCETLFGGFVPYTETTIKKQEYGKIVPIDDFARKRFILWATDNFNIYSLGRYATWKQILLDDVLKDIDIISNFIKQRADVYQRTMHWQGDQQ